MRKYIFAVALMLAGPALAGGDVIYEPVEKAKWNRSYVGLSLESYSLVERALSRYRRRTYTREDNGFSGSINAGIDRQFGNIVVGLRGSAGLGLENFDSSSDLESVFSGLARAGVLLNDRVLAYGGIGYEWRAGDRISDLDGGFYAVGLEALLSENYSAYAEYQDSLEVDQGASVVKVGINRKLNF